ncbi:SAF domain-containing protein [Microbacterium testaceum]|uniref:SAF domain-containing protein n=1 Tax=Microbacterium testaceum TaxID=2033 RepID=UPI002AC514A3|nr:SAF domain-containing protein [Microbacterium testaceum]MDZ5146346.1 SAF domain-containing protein [Microbacterium testaceum]
MTTIAPTRVDEPPALRQDDTKIAPVRRRRPTAWLAAAIAFILLGAIAGYFLYTSASNTTAVFVASTDIPRGSTITQQDLTTISIAAGQNTAAIPATSADKLLGSIATVDIPAGGLVTGSSVASDLPVPSGKAVVGLTLKPGQLPAQKLQAGDSIVIVPVQQTGAAPTTITSSQTIPATVSQVTTVAGTTDVIVDVYVAASAAPDVASRSGSLAIVLTAGATQ